ncbi:hypothetical protein [Leptolyngbya sp. AN10]|uniref:hypothetical protein n=1 Tax=Leptolyngbya sp. AN10 TaxID=3423365 RepID=UPI003D31E43D
MSNSNAVSIDLSSTLDLAITLTGVEFYYVKFLCDSTLQNSDDILCQMIHDFRPDGLPSFSDWWDRHADTVQSAASALMVSVGSDQAEVKSVQQTSALPIEPELSTPTFDAGENNVVTTKSSSTTNSPRTKAKTRTDQASTTPNPAASKRSTKPSSQRSPRGSAKSTAAAKKKS